VLASRGRMLNSNGLFWSKGQQGALCAARWPDHAAVILSVTKDGETGTSRL